jgi:hypothetical protein
VRRGGILQGIAFLAPASEGGDPRPPAGPLRCARSRGAKGRIAPRLGLDRERPSWWDPGIRTIALTALLLLAACEDSNGGAVVACQTDGGTTQHVCTVYVGPGLSMDCAVGIAVPDCPTPNALGTCFYTLSAGGIAESVQTTYYSEGGVTAAQAEMECATFMGSSWVPN